jgi:hypothetical protein
LQVSPLPLNAQVRPCLQLASDRGLSECCTQHSACMMRSAWRNCPCRGTVSTTARASPPQPRTLSVIPSGAGSDAGGGDAPAPVVADPAGTGVATDLHKFAAPGASSHTGQVPDACASPGRHNWSASDAPMPPRLVVDGCAAQATRTAAAPPLTRAVATARPPACTPTKRAAAVTHTAAAASPTRTPRHGTRPRRCAAGCTGHCEVR